MTRVLVIEDDWDIWEGLARLFRREGYTAAHCARGDTAVDAVVREAPDVVVLDVMLPGKSGLDVCRDIRRRGIRVPIIMLTARGDEVDRVVGLEIGADDYVVKPFGRKELLARVRTQLRRLEGGPAPGAMTYRFGTIEIDFGRYQATRDGQSMDLSPKELHLLQLLVRYRGQVIGREQMLRDVWGYEAAPTSRTVDTHILKLRQKIEDDPANPKWILSIYGEGYKFLG